jgi:hypothetical protein
VKIRQLLAALAVALLGTTGSGAGVLYTFEGSNAGGIGSATMDVDITNTRILIKLNNTSPTTLIGGSGVNAPAITGFGLSFTNPNDFTLTTWDLFAFDANDLSICIGDSSGNSCVRQDWARDAKGPSQPLDLFLDTELGVQGGLYNPAATAGLAALPNYFTEATFQIMLDTNLVKTPEILELFNGQCNQGHPCSPFVRMQNVGEDGEGSLRLSPGGPFPPQGVPEPGTLALLGLALVAGTLARMRARA